MSRFLIYFKFSFNQVRHSKAIVVLHGKVENFCTVIWQEEKVSVWETRMQTHMRKEEYSGKTRDDLRCDGLNWKNKGRAEQKKQQKNQKRKKIEEKYTTC